MEMIIDFPGGSRVDAHFGSFTVNTDQPPAASAPSPFEVFEIPFRDLVKWEKMHAALEEIPNKKVGNIMSLNLHEVRPDDSVQEAASIMTRHRINRLPVVEDGRLVGIVTRGDIISGLGMQHAEN